MYKSLIVSALSIVIVMPGFSFTASDNAGNPAYNSGWTNGSNGGTGFGPWSLGPYTYATELPVNFLATNSFVDIKTNGRAWGMAGTADVFAYAGMENVRSFDVALSPGDVFSFDFDNGIQQAQPGSFNDGGFGLSLFNSSSTAATREMTGFYCWTGNLPLGNYWVVGSTQVNMGPQVTNGVHVDIKILDATSFKTTVTPFGGTAVETTGTFKNPGPAVKFRLWMYNLASSGDGSYDTYLNNLSVHPDSSQTITGKVTLQDFDLGDPSTISCVFTMRDAGGAVLDTKTQLLAADGSFSFTTSASGIASVSAKPTHWLTKKLAYPGALNFSVTNGDIDNDDSITVFDYGVLSDYFDKSNADSDWTTVGGNGFAPVDADVDADGAVTVFDYGIISDNFDKSGDS